MTDRIPPLSLAALAALTLAGCGSSTSPHTGTLGLPTSTLSPSPSPLSTSGSTTATPKAHPIASASAERDKLLALAKPGTKLSAQGTVPGWPPANGSGIPATLTEISGFGFVVDKAKNVQYLSFAVTDAAGKCAGGDLDTNAAGTRIVSAKPIALPARVPCTGDEVSKLAGHS